MPDESALLVPVRSNGSALLTGKPVESVRKRLKFASLYFDYVFLETGIFDMSAGPGGSSGFVRPPLDEEIPRWQATLYPFADELPAGTDWISFTRTLDPAGEIGRMTDR